MEKMPIHSTKMICRASAKKKLELPKSPRGILINAREKRCVPGYNSIKWYLSAGYRRNGELFGNTSRSRNALRVAILIFRYDLT